MKNNILIKPLCITLALLTVPFLGNIFVEGWNWDALSFVLIGGFIFTAAFLYEWRGKYAKHGVLGGFLAGMMVMCGIIAYIKHINPGDDIAGFAVLLFFVCGLLFSVLGYWVAVLRRR